MENASNPFVHSTHRVLTVEGEDGEPEDGLILNGARMVRLWLTDDVPATIATYEHVTDDGLGRLPKKFCGIRIYSADLPGDANGHQILMNTPDSVD